jgi:hypothetical protein
MQITMLRWVAQMMRNYAPACLEIEQISEIAHSKSNTTDTLMSFFDILCTVHVDSK